MPEVRLHDPVVSDRLTVVDLLSHRSGLPRHEIAITVEGGVLRPRLGTLDLSLTHRHYETFDLEWHELGDQSHLFPLMFLSDPDGDITALKAKLLASGVKESNIVVQSVPGSWELPIACSK